MKTIGKVIYFLIVLTLISIAGVIAFSAFDIPGGIKMYTVMSGSMTPSIPVGGLVVVKESNKYNLKDIITFTDIEDPKFSVTHRIIEIKDEDSNPKYYTKGDANNARDADEVTKDRISGKVILTIPYLGYPVSFAKTQNGFIALIVIPATLLIYGEILNIKKELTNILNNRREKKVVKETDEKNDNS
jgi:signal peptidase I